MPKKQNINNLFVDIQAKLCQWLEKRPTGQFSVNLSINEGGLRGRPEIVIKEKI